MCTLLKRRTAGVAMEDVDDRSNSDIDEIQRGPTTWQSLELPEDLAELFAKRKIFQGEKSGCENTQTIRNTITKRSSVKMFNLRDALGLKLCKNTKMKLFTVLCECAVSCQLNSTF